MFQDFLVKKMLKSQGVSDEQINQLLVIINKNPELFKQIAEEAQTKIKSGMEQKQAMMSVMQAHEAELKTLFQK